MAERPYEVVVSPESAGWGHAGLRVVRLPVGGRVRFGTGPDEMLVLPLAGGCDVACDDERLTLTGRRSVFSRVTDFAYLPRDTTVILRAPVGGRFALPSARAGRVLPFRYGPAEEVPVEIRGAGPAGRQINRLCTPESFEADSLIACEVLVPGGHWSSYPPHEHDQEEIYYFEVAGAGCGYHRTGETCSVVRTGDVALVREGPHGPAMASPGYDLYHLNVLAGAGERRCLYRDDPAYGVIPPDRRGGSRLPLTSVTEKRRVDPIKDLN
ncbi:MULTISPECIES: 5-deoxy-glucuronate isomerase [Actinoplanes]|uniref:5-deoxy-glucuronate isomerase n=1 Tax=Actinoplanes TaxID=1865 RepID=UPI001FE1381D|nr:MULTISPECIES: 5-deoxy-glucuronate isomerase [Actinoplanes]